MALKSCILFKFMHKEIGIPFFLILLFLGGILLSCDDRTINPYEENQGVFSVYGALDMDEERHVIRVRNLLETFRSDSTFPIDATLTFTDPENGTSKVLNDSIIYFPAGKVHNYILFEDLKPSHPYHLTVERSDGIKVQANVTTPGATDITYIPEKIFYCEELIEFRFDNVRPDELLQMEVGVLYQGEEHWAPIRLIGQFEYEPFEELMIMEMRPRHLLTEIFPPTGDTNFFREDLLRYTPDVMCEDLDREFFMFRYIHLGPDWTGVISNDFGIINTDSGDIENGLGFLGAYRTGSFSFEFAEGIPLKK